MSLQRALTEARRKEEQQKRLILQIQEQKKTMEEQRNSLLHFAETLQTTQGEKRKVNSTVTCITVHILLAYL